MEVAPFTGAWIETFSIVQTSLKIRSPPSRGRGLKLNPLGKMPPSGSRPLHGGVD